MRVLLTILGVLAGIIVLLLILGLFIKKEYRVEREIVINKPGSTVFGYVKFIRNQDNYSLWNQVDPNMKKTYTGTDGTPGFVYAWDSQVKEAGKGEQEITSVKDGKVETDLHFIKPFEGRAKSYITTGDAQPGQTTVKWGVYGRMTYPMNLMLPFMNMDKTMGRQLEKGLANLKTIMEKQ